MTTPLLSWHPHPFFPHDTLTYTPSGHDSRYSGIIVGRVCRTMSQEPQRRFTALACRSKFKAWAATKEEAMTKLEDAFMDAARKMGRA